MWSSVFFSTCATRLESSPFEDLRCRIGCFRKSCLSQHDLLNKLCNKLPNSNVVAPSVAFKRFLLNHSPPPQLRFSLLRYFHAQIIVVQNRINFILVLCPINFPKTFNESQNDIAERNPAVFVTAHTPRQGTGFSKLYLSYVYRR